MLFSSFVYFVDVDKVVGYGLKFKELIDFYLEVYK